MVSKKSGLFIIILLIGLLIACGEDDLSSGIISEPESSAVDENKNTNFSNNDFFDSYATFIQNLMDESGTPGVAVAVVEGNKTVFAQGFGLRDVANNKPVTPQTLFHIGSTNKSFTAMMLATLVDDGLLDWDTPVVEIYPEFELSDSEATKSVTLRHLLSMRGGIPDEAEEYFDVYNSTADDVIPFLAEVELNGLPGDKFSYSNISSATSGYLGVIASSKSDTNLYDGYVQLLERHILQPIGMTGAVIRVSEAQQNSDYGKSYYLDDDGSPLEAESEDIDGDPLAPSGTLKANVLDMAKYISTQLGRGVAPNGQRVVSEKNITELWQPYLEDYGMGWQINDYNGVKVTWHDGSFDNYLSVIGFVPELDMGFVILTNSADGAGTIIEESPLFLIDLYLEK